jgi:tRNA pseudouridine38-40 synthase
MNPAKEFSEAALAHVTPVSTFCVPQMSAEENLYFERLYIDSIKKHKPKQQLGEAQRQPNPDIKRLPKRKVVLLMSYCGTGYQGMQVNPDVPSIELDLHKALAKSGAISAENAMDPTKSSFMRCARTDKGVHAAGQVVSMKMIVEDPDIIQKINSFLPKQIRIWGFSRVNNSFHAKNMCDSRIYEYILPTYCLMDVNPELYPYSQVGMDNNIEQKIPDWVPLELPLPKEADIKKLSSYRVDKKRLAQFAEMLKQFVGTKNHHNFTMGKGFKDHSAKRYITSFTTGEPFIKNGREFVSLKVHGQSFMIHQIRKMIGICIMMTRTQTPISLLSKCFSETRLNVPKAPGLGLLLERPVFEKYNDKTGSGDRLELQTIDFDLFKAEIDAFKDEFIYDLMSKEEEEKNVFEEWMRIVDSCSGDYGWYLGADGEISEERKNPELFKKGVNTGRVIPTGSAVVDGVDDEQVESEDGKAFGKDAEIKKGKGKWKGGDDGSKKKRKFNKK